MRNIQKGYFSLRLDRFSNNIARKQSPPGMFKITIVYGGENIPFKKE